MPMFPPMQNDSSSPLGVGPSTLLLLVGVITGFIVAAIFGLAQMKVPVPWLSKLGLLIGTAVFVVPALLYARSQGRDLLSVFRIRRVSGTVLLASLILGVGMVIGTDALDKRMAPSINAYLDRTLGSISPDLKSDRILEQMKAQFTIGDWWSGILLVLAAVCAAAVCEETLIRGMFQQALEQRTKAAAAVAISSVVFAMIHFNPWGGIQILFIALVLGVVAWRSDSVLPTILIHAVNNGLVILMNNLPEDRLRWYGTEHSLEPGVLIVGSVLLIGGWMALWKATRRT